MKKITYKLFLVFSISFTMVSCSTSVIEEVVVNEEITYFNTIKAIIVTNCTTTCHNDVQTDAGLNLTSYKNLKDAVETRGLLDRINSASNPMPKGGQMEANLIATIEKWVDEGFIVD